MNTQDSHNSEPAAAPVLAISVPGYEGTLPRFKGIQPLFAAARFVSEEGIGWGYADFSVNSAIEKPYQFDDQFDMGWEEWYDYDPTEWNSWIFVDVDREYDTQFKWGASCGIHQDERDPPHILRGSQTKLDENNQSVDNYWEVCIINRDQPEFWTYLMTGDEGDLDVDWMQSHTDVRKEVMNWIRDNPDTAERWLTVAPTPHELVGESGALKELISDIQRAIRQGRID